MASRHYGAGWLLFFAAVNVGCYAKSVNQVSTNGQVRVLRVAVGQSIAGVERASGISFHLDHLLDNSAVVIDDTVSVEYDDTEYGFRLPATRFVLISQFAGVVTGVDTSPQLAFSSLAEAHALALQTKTLIQSAHWALVREYPSDLAVVQRLVADPTRSRRFEKDYAEFRARNLNLRIYVKEVMGVGLENRQPPVKRNLFLTNVDVIDAQLASTATEKVYAKRREVTGDINQSLPLSVWLHDKP